MSAVWKLGSLGGPMSARSALNTGPRSRRLTGLRKAATVPARFTGHILSIWGLATGVAFVFKLHDWHVIFR